MRGLADRAATYLGAAAGPDWASAGSAGFSGFSGDWNMLGNEVCREQKHGSVVREACLPTEAGSAGAAGGGGRPAGGLLT